MKRRRKNSEESSLELLLDTMCNTFGGVMFIAISIFVIISGMTQSNSPESKLPPVDTAQIQQQILDLQVILKELQKQISDRTAELQLKKATSQDDKLQHLIMLEQLHKNMLQQYETLSAAGKVLHKTVLQADEKLKNLRDQSAKNQQKTDKLSADILALELKLQALQQQKIASLQMNFKIIESSKYPPYFIIFSGDYVYPVGPIRAVNINDFTVHDAVEHSINQSGDQAGGVTCTPKTGHGTPVMENDQLSGSFKSLLQSIPKNRVPLFYIPPSSAPIAFRMREILKNQDVLHGINLAANDYEPFTFYFTQKADYEY